MSGPASDARAAHAAADAAARRAAVQRFEGCVALEAGAGTGKTTVLVNRVVAWCLGPGWERARSALRAEAAGPHPERVARRVLGRVVAITFTEAAAAEMALRIGQAFRALERGERPVGLEAEDVPEARLSAERARALLAALDQLVVQSIHAWCRRLLASHPLEAGLHPRFEVDGDGAGQLAAVRAALREALAEAFAAGPESDLVQLCMRDASADDIEQLLVDLLGQGVEASLFDDDPFAPERVAALLAELAAALRALVDAGRGCAEATDVSRRLLDAARGCLADVEGASPCADSLAALGAQVSERFPRNLLERLGEWRAGAFKRREEAALGDAASALTAAAAALRPLLVHVAALDPELLGRARRVVRALLADAHARLRREGLAPFATLLCGARALLADEPEIAAQERRKIDQLLVDEFQDTDPVQCEIVARLALEGPADERPGLFLVGDPKQSIYGWRSADLAAYESFLERALAGAAPLTLAVNRRSPAAILDEVERVVGPVMRAERGVQARFEPLLEDPERSAAAPAHPVEGWVCFEPEDLERDGRPKRARDESARLEAEALARDLRRLHDAEGASFSDCAVLVRSSSQIDDVLDALREEGVPFAVESDRSYYQRREVLDAAALVRAILDPSDALALVAWLRSPSVGVPDAAWLPLFERELPRLARELHGDDLPRLEEVAAAVRAAAAAIPDGVPGLERLAGFEESLIAALHDLARLRASFETEAPDRFVERLRRVTLVEASEAARHLGAHRLAHLERFLRDLLGWLEDGVADAASVARALREASAREPDPFEGPPRSPLGDAVRVMTVHKAKGLDFDHVYVLSIEREPGGRGREASAVCRGDEPREYRLLGASTPGFHALEALRGRKRRAEDVRTLYVALTRARRRVVVSGRFALETRPAGEARSYADLLRHRRGGLPDLAHETLAAAREGRTDVVQGGVRWRFPALERAAAGAGARAGAAACPGLASAEAIAAASERLALLGAAARARARRPRSRGAAPEKDAGRDELRLEERLGAEAGAGRTAPALGPARDAALAIGSAVHAALERLDLGGSEGEARAQAEAALAKRLRGELGSGRDAAAAEREGRRLLAGFFGGPLFEGLRGLGPNVVARELPVLLAAGEGDGADAPVGCWSGVVDLVYRDPATGELAIADYKTDRVTAEEAPARARGYRAQGLVYARALRAALELPALPRFELWFLGPGRIEVVPLDGASGGG